MSCAIAARSSSSILTPSPRILSPPTTFYKIAASPPPPPTPSCPSRLSINYVPKPLNGGGADKVGPAMVMKRKRPARIEIPAASAVAIDDIKTIPDFDRLSEVEVEGEGYSVHCKRGRRGGVMEDRYATVFGSNGDSKQAFFGVFDGHGGAGAAEFAAKNLEKNIMNEVLKGNGEGIEKAVKEGYLTTDSDFLKEDIRGGSCCVSALIHDGDLVVSNAGDCRAVMSRGGVSEALTVDHRPSLHHEKERIESMGGYVDCTRGVWRVHGSLAVSRAIGDRHLKKWVIAEPETRVIKISPDCEFLILASDGLWDKVNNQEAVDVVRPLLTGVVKSEALSACKKLVDLSLIRGSTDDISVMVVQLTRFFPRLQR